MRVAIYGVDQVSQIVAQIIEQIYNPTLEQHLGEKLDVVAFVKQLLPDNASTRDNIAILNPIQLAALYHKKLIDKIIFSRNFLNSQRTEIPHLISLGINLDDIYISDRTQMPIDFANCFKPYISAKFLPYLEYHIADHCNLNCKYCEHYSGLVQTPKFTNFKRFVRDFEQLHKFIDDIGTIRILGGEPLLNPEINEYVKLSRQLYPLADISVVTNAILLPKMPEEFFDTLRENKVNMHISFYPPLESKMSAMRKFLHDKRVSYFTLPLINKFTIKQTLTPHDKKRKVFLRCLQATCNNLYEGKIAPCFLPFTTKYFNEYYEKNLPEDGALDLYEEGLTTEKLKLHLLTPFERCRYCGKPFSVKWETVKYPSPITDWTNDHLLDDDAVKFFRKELSR